MRNWLLAAVGILCGAWALYSIAVVDQVVSPAGGAIIPPAGSGIFDSIRYQEATGTLTLVFKSGYGYEYYEVPRACYEGLRLAACQGGYFNRNIRSCYPCRRIDDGHDAAPGHRVSGGDPPA